MGLMGATFGGGATGTNGGNGASGTTNFTFKINDSESMPINPAGTAAEIAKQLA
jgi:hypothetical protein